MVKTLVGLNCNPQSGCQKGWRDGGAMYAQVNSPKGVRFAPIVDANTNTQRLAISDSGNNRIRFITLSSPLAVTWAGGNVSTVAGSSNAGLAEGVPREGLAEEASFSTPQGLYFTSDAQRLLIADLDNNRIRLLTRTFCPNFRTEGTEECDDGNSLDNDGCSSRCTVESGFQCTSGCRTFCEFMRPSTCVAVCGDARNAASEECDDGNLISGDGCSKYCQVERGWACLPGRGGEREREERVASKESTSVCRPVCGDGYVRAGEECDDGNLLSGDGCSWNCTREKVGGGELAWDGRSGAWFFVQGNVTVSAAAYADVVPTPQRLLLFREAVSYFTLLEKEDVVVIGAWTAGDVAGEVVLFDGFGSSLRKTSFSHSSPSSPSLRAVGGGGGGGGGGQKRPGSQRRQSSPSNPTKPGSQVQSAAANAMALMVFRVVVPSELKAVQLAQVLLI